MIGPGTSRGWSIWHTSLMGGESRMTAIKQQVREFYDRVGWQEVGEGVYQNARYEDLRPVSREYIHRCHLRVSRHLKPGGEYLLDAGSGPIQYPEYLDYSRGFQRRVCADISIIALKEARQRIGDHGLFVVADIANLPFKADAFDGVVSLHTIHHLPEAEHLNAFIGLYQVLTPGSSAVVVNGWPSSMLMSLAAPAIRLGQLARRLVARLARRPKLFEAEVDEQPPSMRAQKAKQPKGTFINRHDARWIKQEVGARMPVEILVWRSVSVRFLRVLIHTRLGGRLWLRLLFWFEERFPSFFGEHGQYPMIVLQKALRD